MTNIDLSHARHVDLFAEDDKTLRTACVSIYTMPLQKGKEKLQPVMELPEVSICQHWGVLVEFKQTNKGFGRCIYTFDADLANEFKSKDGGVFTSMVKLMEGLLKGRFIIKVFAYYPDQNEKHPYEEFVKTPNKNLNNEIKISPYQLLQVSRLCATDYQSKSYNVIFNNCQTFAKHFCLQIRQHISLGIPSYQRTLYQREEMLTAGDTAHAVIGGAAILAAGALIFKAIFASDSFRNGEKALSYSDDDDTDGD